MKAYQEHSGKVIDQGRFKHVMALTLNPANLREGVIRCIVSRQGDVGVKGFIDQSRLYKVKSVDGLEKLQITTPVTIQGTEELVKNLLDNDHQFLGLEDPDLVIDPETNLLHLYFTLPFIKKDNSVESFILLGHAEGRDLESLKMTDPVLPFSEVNFGRAKELSLAPVNSKGVRLNLVESKDRIDGVSYSTVRVAKSKGFGPPWKQEKTIFHPKFDGYPWCAGHASPGPLLPKEFINHGENHLVGFFNGREVDRRVGDKTKHGMFSVGLFVYDFENGKIEWVSPKPLIVDSQANTITFASCFVQTKPGEGILYAHVDDSFVRAYTLYASGLKSLLPQ